MTKKTSVFIAGRNLARARTALGYSQGEFVALYLSTYNMLSEAEQRQARKLDGPALSRIENSTAGDFYSKVKLRTAEIMALLLKVEPDTLYQAAAAPLAEKIKEPLPTPTGNSVRFVAGQATLDAVDLPYIPVPFRAAFASAGGQLTSLSSTNMRRVYLRGKPISMFTDRAIFEVDGDSMEPYINSGDEVTACRVEESRWETVINCIVVVCYGDRITIKKVIENDLSSRGTLTLLPYRSELAALIVRRSEIRAMYVVETVTPRSFRAII